ncbi:UDP-galactopyranose mutase [Caldimonas sp. KR1-144]|uniref:UDP-galactopyranose mutase n=1 Tax=Caldimonas sp. KR1-144 TaxID=3400911 RepID=UPI003C0B3459
MIKFDWLVVGAGLTGLTFAERMASRFGRKVMVIDRRSHLGGNTFDAPNEHGILTHVYGPHIFHTNSQKVWDYLSVFTRWRPYEHRVLGLVEGSWIPIPFNLTSIDRVFDSGEAAQIKEMLVAQYGFGAKVPILDLKQCAQPRLQALAGFVYEHVFLHYTRKQWELEPEDLDAAVTARVPVFVSHDDRYFQDTYQAMPQGGYGEMARRMADVTGVEVHLGMSHLDAMQGVAFDRMFFTGRIDEYFDFELGRLPYRSLRFQHETLSVDRFQTTGTHNYPGLEPFTRITEQKTLTGQVLNGKTGIVTEYPVAHKEGENEPYYPIPREENRALYQRYADLAARKAPNVVFAGRLGDYQYYNMDQAVARALMLSEKMGAV